MRLTFFLSLFTTFLTAQGFIPGYVVLHPNDTLRGRVIIKENEVRLKTANGKVDYAKGKLRDYGYYANQNFFSKPDEIPVMPKSKLLCSLVFQKGDTLHNFHLNRVHPDVVQGYFSYPEFEMYYAEKAELTEVILHNTAKTRHFDLIELEDYPKSGNLYPVYVKRKEVRGIRAYNIDNTNPYSEDNSKSKLIRPALVALSGGLVAGLMQVVSDQAQVNDVKEQNPFDWVIYKDENIYNINSGTEWQKTFREIFKNDEGFLVYLKEQKVSRKYPEKVIDAYGDWSEMRRN